MSVRKRVWTTRKSETKETWILDYVANGSRHIETFQREKDADAREAEVTVNVDKGIHTAASKSITVAQAAADWISYIEGEGRERSTIERYKQFVRLHIIPRLGNEKLAKLTSPRINSFRDELLKSSSRAMAKKGSCRPQGHTEGRQEARQRRTERCIRRFNYGAWQNKG